MAQNLASTYAKQIDERFRKESLTDAIINKGIRLDFAGVNSVTIYTIDAVTEGNYTRTGTNRFGTLAELGTGKQTFVLSQDKAFTYTIDRGNLEDSMKVQEAASTLKRVIAETCVPNTDIYRLTTLQAYAVANSQKNDATAVALTTSNAYSKLLQAQAKLDDLLVPAAGRYAFATPATVNLWKQDPNFVKASDMAQEMLVKGVVGEIDGVSIVKVPTSYLPANTGFLLVHKTVLVAPSKFDTFRILDQVQGIDGWVVEGRRYYDAFVPTNAGKALIVHMNA